jgi:rhomboid protease GluP
MRDVLLRIKINTQITYILLAANIIIWLVMELVGGSTNAEVLIIFGALERELVFSGQWWRMVSSAFLHIGVLHLLVNSYTLYQLGPFIESFFGQSKFIATYVLTAVSASVVSILFSPSISAGASGALFGLIGLLLGNAWAQKRYTLDLPIDEMQLIPFVIFNLAIGFINPQINNWAHIGGLVGGILLGYIFDPAISFDPSRMKKILPTILRYISLFILGISIIFWILNIFGIF